MHSVLLVPPVSRSVYSPRLRRVLRRRLRRELRLRYARHLRSIVGFVCRFAGLPHSLCRLFCFFSVFTYSVLSASILLHNLHGTFMITPIIRFIISFSSVQMATSLSTQKLKTFFTPGDFNYAILPPLAAIFLYLPRIWPDQHYP